MSRTLPIAVDPTGCGCTECITGVYKPLELADDVDLLGVLLGHAGNNTGLTDAELLRELGHRQAASDDEC